MGPGGWFVSLGGSPHGKTRSTIPNGIILCDVDYDNLNSGGSGSYLLEVDFEDEEPVRINFPNGGWRHVLPIESGSGWECEEDGVPQTQPVRGLSPIDGKLGMTDSSFY